MEARSRVGADRELIAAATPLFDELGSARIRD
jgi:hypothetical protein